MANSKLAGLISGICLGLSSIFMPLNSSSYAGGIISNYYPSSPEKSERESRGFGYFDKVSQEETQNKIKIIQKKARTRKYINMDEMNLIADNCSQKTLEDAALCFFSSVHARNKNGLRKILFQEESIKSIDKIVEKMSRYKNTKFRIKPVRWVNGKYAAKIDYFIQKTKNKYTPGGTVWGWFIKKEGKWYYDMIYSLKNPLRKKDFPNYTLYISEEFAKKIGLKNSSGKEWVKVPKEIQKKLLNRKIKIH